MKYAIVIPDGCADEPQESLGGKTPLEAAQKPYMDRIARMGVVGRTNNVPESLTPASDVATLSLFGYDPLVVYTGRAPLETAAMGISLGPGDWAIRCNLVTVENGLMSDFTAGHISSADGKALMELLHRSLGDSMRLAGQAPPEAQVEFHPGVSYRNIMVLRAAGRDAPFTHETRTQPPHDIPDRPIADYMPKGPGADILNALMTQSTDILARAPANLARAGRGEKPATQIWLWGQGQRPTLESFAKRFGKKGAIISAVDLVRGVGTLLGWTRIDVAGATGYLDTDYAAKGWAAKTTLKDHDLVCVHVEAPDEASHEGKVEAKVRALEEIDRHIVGPLLDAMPAFGSWRILVCPDHRTLVRTRSHAHGVVPFTIAGTGIRAAGLPGYNEVYADQADLFFAQGNRLMRWFLRGNLPDAL
jgi:2,3-bisphosphoglycerate-independent phosphoglycerate mutase